MADDRKEEGQAERTTDASPDVQQWLTNWWWQAWKDWNGYLHGGLLLRLQNGEWGLETVDGQTRVTMPREMATGVVMEHLERALAPPQFVIESIAAALVSRAEREAEKLAARN